jgi:sugar lactone lactonase YvrE
MHTARKAPVTALGTARLAIAGLAIAASLVLPLSSAGAAEISFPFTAQVPNDEVAGSGAGRLVTPQGIATDPVSHRIYVSDQVNRRVSAYTPWGEFVMAFGWGVRNGDAELQTCTTATGCQQGLTGSGPGQFGEVPAKSLYQGPTGIAVDGSGDIYVMDLGNFRVQKFDSEGNFLLTFGGKVNQTTGGNLCTAGGDTCVAGQLGTGNGEFAIENVFGVESDHVDIGPDGTVYVGDKDRIQTFEPNGEFKSSFPLPEPGNPGALAVDPNSGTIYFARAAQPNVYTFSPSGELLETTLAVENPVALAVEQSGDVYVVSDPLFNKAPRVAKFAPDGSLLGEFGATGPDAGPPVPGLTGLATGVITETGESDVYVGRSKFDEDIASFRIYGAVPDPDLVGPPPSVPPQITDQFAVSVDSGSAILRAAINPRFWDDTTFYVEYGTVDCEVGPCNTHPAPPGKLLTNTIISTPVVSPGVFLGGLQPGTTYHYRFVADSGGGSPVFGEDHTFTTPAVPAGIGTDCPNAAFRLGPASFLPDCRAYEMVSPVDKNGADIINQFTSDNLPAARNQAAADGDKLTYTSQNTFGEAVGSPWAPQYLAVRGASGWQNKSISPPRSSATLSPFFGLASQFKALTPDLCTAWIMQDAEPALAANGVAGFPGLYKQDLCGGGGYEAVTAVPPPERGPGGFFFESQGYSADGSHSIFRADDKLSEIAPSGVAAKVYDYSAGETTFVCVLPNGSPFAGGCSAGTAGGSIASDQAGSVKNAVSADGSVIFWTAAESDEARLYARVEGEATAAISKGAARFQGASPDGARVIFSEAHGKIGEAGDLYAFDLEEDFPEKGSLIASDVEGVMGMSQDASRVYLVATEALDGAAVAGEPNLYLYEEGQGFDFIATLSADDFDSAADISPVADVPWAHAARVTPDGESLAFISKASLTGADSRDWESGKPLSQVYLYDADGGELVCASCNPTGVRPVGHFFEIKGGEEGFLSAAFLPTLTNQLYAPRALSDDGNRLYFNSGDALVPRDTNGAADVYQWEAQGSGDCAETGGCVSLISSGKSPKDSEFVDADADGSDVYFKTGSSLVEQDPGLIDIYDARVGGGFPPPPPAPPECAGDACQSVPAPPNDPTPASAAFRGAGDPRTGPVRVRCPKGKRRAKASAKGKARCVKRTAKRGHDNRRAGK